MVVLAALALLQGSTSAVTEHRIANIFKPRATPAEYENNIALFVIAVTAAIFVVVAALIIFTMIRFRRRADDHTGQEPPQVYGSNQIEVAWTVIPILIVFVLIGVTARVVASVENASPPASTLKVTLIGHQWWWEVRYPDFGIVTANEIHVPISRSPAKTATYLRLESVDVIHSFWVPQLSGKMDLIPNRDNFLWIDPHEPGTYLGNCAEYCGTQHANMLLRVIAEEPDDFKEWASEQQRPAADSSQSAEAKAAFESFSCVNCHAVKGTSAIGNFGPDLTHLMSRRSIGAGVLDNTPENLRAWVNDPQIAKPGCLMPSMKLTDQQLDQVIAYLEGLR